MNIAADLKEIIILVDQRGLVTLLEHMAASPVALVEIDRVARLKSLHELGKIAPRRLDQQMDVVRQQAIRQQIDLLVLTIKRELFQVSLSVKIVAEDCLPVIPPADDMIDGSGIFDA